MRGSRERDYSRTKSLKKKRSDAMSGPCLDLNSNKPAWKKRFFEKTVEI